VADTKIEWADAVWNPLTGCTMVSEGCRFCYAVTMTRRLAAMGQEKYAGLVNPGKGHFNGVVQTHDDALCIPLTWRKPRRVFVNSMSDLFHKEVPFEFIDKVFAVMALTPQHTYQVLTKRPERAAEYMNYIDSAGFCAAARVQAACEFWQLRCTKDYPWSVVYDFALNKLARWPLPNVWLGTSVEDGRVRQRIDELRRIPAAIRFLSCEPLIGPLDDLDLTGIHWVIVGGESGPGARPMHPDWARSLRDQCTSAGVPFFFKQWGEWRPMSATCIGCGDDGWVAPTPEARYVYENGFSKSPKTLKSEGFAYMVKVGKKRAGRMLDGRTWDEFPEARP
jgi:protein gp37